MDSAVAQLNCDAACVNTCTAAALTIDAKARCLETCLCYATPAVTVPATPIATPVAAPVATPVATPVSTPVATPVVADPVAATPVVADAPVIVNAEPAADAAAQVLFLSEAGIVHSATGALSGAFIVAMILVFVTLLGAAFLHLEEKGDLINKAKTWSAGFRKGTS